MPYDIYGQPLKRNHCEVHPDHYGSYPCDLCIEESYRYARQQDYYNDLRAEYEAEQQKEYERHLRHQWYTDRAIHWLLHNRNNEPLPDWWHQ